MSFAVMSFAVMSVAVMSFAVMSVAVMSFAESHQRTSGRVVTVTHHQRA